MKASVQIFLPVSSQVVLSFLLISGRSVYILEESHLSCYVSCELLPGCGLLFMFETEPLKIKCFCLSFLSLRR